ncbi:MAG: hypothetical protein AAF223_05490, partial [Bacteroidota bacterium]
MHLSTHQNLLTTLSIRKLSFLLSFIIISFSVSAQKKMSNKQIEKLKEEAATAVADNYKLTQVMIDKIFSFSELGMQEFETSEYITGILEENGFTIEKGISGVPTAWTATWGSGK